MVVTIEIPDMPIIPIDLNDSDMKFLESLEGKLSKIDVVKIEGNTLYAYGTNQKYERRYVEIIGDRNHGEISIESHMDPDTFGETFIKLFSFGVYQLGADAVIHYQIGQETDYSFENHMGTPVKFSGKL